MAENQDNAQQAQDQAPQQVFQVQKLYLKDVSFESPNAPDVFRGEWQPETNVQISTEASQLAEGVHEVVLGVTVTTKSGEATAYLVEVKQAGIFTLQGFEPQQLGHMLGSYCPNFLYPFAREAVADLIVKGGFPGFMLAPVNFDALYAQHLQERAAKGDDGANTPH